MSVTCWDDRVKRLIDAGVISPRCRRFDLTLEARGVAVLRQEIYVTHEEFDALAALLPDADAKTVVVDEIEQDKTLDVTPLGKEWREKLPKP